MHDNFTEFNWDYDVALMKVCIFFSLLMHNEMSCDIQLYLMLLHCKMQFF